MSMTRFRAGQLWSNPLDIRIGRTTYRTATATGWVGAEFILKLFSARGRAMTFPGRVSRSSTTLVGSVDSPFVIGSGGLQAQVYWKFQYDLNIGGLGRFARLPGARNFLNFRVTGLSNIIQQFDIVPARRPGRPHTGSYRSMRGDNRTRGSSPWSWDFSHSRRSRDGRDGPILITESQATLPIDFSGSFSSEVSASVGAEVGWNLGPEVVANTSVGAAAGASLDWQIRRRLEMRLNGSVNLYASR